MADLRPNAMAVIFSDDHDQRHVCQTTEVSETAGRVPCAGTNQAFATVVMQALDGWNGFHILEATSGAQATFLWPVSVEGDPEVAHAEGLAKGFCFVGRGSSNVLI